MLYAPRELPLETGHKRALAMTGEVTLRGQRKSLELYLARSAQLAND